MKILQFIQNKKTFKYICAPSCTEKQTHGFYYCEINIILIKFSYSKKQLQAFEVESIFVGTVIIIIYISDYE